MTMACSMAERRKRRQKGRGKPMTANVQKETRKKIYRRDGYRCALCDGTRYIQIHHVVPRGQGGPRDNTANMITLCADCHALAHGMDLRGYGASPEDVEQAMIEYMADLYAGEGVPWTPWMKEDPVTERRYGTPPPL